MQIYLKEYVLRGGSMEITGKDVNYKSKDGEITGFIAMPSDDDSYPGIILVHEIFGLDDHIRDVAKRIAKEGYVVLAPHLFSSSKYSDTLTHDNTMTAMKFMMSIPPEKQRDEEYRKEQLSKLDDSEKEGILSVFSILFENRPVDTFTDYLVSGVEYLASLDNVNGRIGSAGFCFGGGMSINLACRGKTDASVIFYGENPEPIDNVANIKGPVMGLYGGEDSRINSHIHELVEAMTKNKIPFTMRVFKGAHHAFFNDARKQTYNEDAAKESWNMLLKFFRENLQK